ncbi:MAG: tRNA (adenosine(37)-N6)-threonylcarbamoyltransferase complex ATPase subunit type 1 TsaE [Bacteroidales bacterium]|jgi:tRNA threonylcarbamoyladenosine biosynthesis protein TsaE|nr:tRNA (adenosine(37)-N6)-threonylcarbamoyltransferase complex ATPase subunit type 1 TsaE [Bacteroidales bacterium]
MIKKTVKENELPALAKEIISTFPEQRIFAFYGEMGAGKTTLIKELCKVLQVTDQTSSPTFAIINEYFTADDSMVYHFDFYRIESKKEIEEIGITDYLESGNYCFVEWPENSFGYLIEPYIKIEIQTDNQFDRIYHCFFYQ